MNKLLIILIFAGFLNFTSLPEKTTVPVMNFKQFEPRLHLKNDTVYLINFWATWCGPCRDEIPAIEKVREKYKNDKFRILLVSIDVPNQLNSRLLPFIRSYEIKSDVLLLDDPNQNVWINKVDPGWSGEIPFTVIYGKDFRDSYNQSFTYQILDSVINLKLNSKQKPHSH